MSPPLSVCVCVCACVSVCLFLPAISLLEWFAGRDTRQRVVAQHLGRSEALDPAVLWRSSRCSEQSRQFRNYCSVLEFLKWATVLESPVQSQKCIVREARTLVSFGTLHCFHIGQIQNSRNEQRFQNGPNRLLNSQNASCAKLECCSVLEITLFPHWSELEFLKWSTIPESAQFPKYVVLEARMSLSSGSLQRFHSCAVLYWLSVVTGVCYLRGKWYFWRGARILWFCWNIVH